MKAPISACIIVRNEEKTLEKCLQSIRPYVQELVVVDTGSNDASPEIAKRYADIFEVYTDCNHNGEIESFSQARQRSFDLATNSTVLWMDADDELVGGENLIKYTDKYRDIKTPHFIQFPYEYSYDNEGNPTLIHYRERLLFNKRYFNWVNPVHEVCIPKADVAPTCEVQDDIIWKHRRQFVNKTIQPNRNLRILKKWYDKHGESDARQLYYIGLEYGNNGEIDTSRKFLNRYLELSGWDDEKYMAILRLIDYDLMEGNYKSVIEYALKAITIQETWGEAYFILAKAYYFLANSGIDEVKNWNKCINFAGMGLILPPTKTLLFVNPNERNIEIHRYLNTALSKVGRITEALQSVNAALKHAPDHQELLLNKSIYQEHLFRENLKSLLTEHGVSADKKSAILSVLDNTSQESNMNEWVPYHRPAEYPRNVQESDFPVAQTTPHAQAWGIPETFVYDDLPLKMTDAQLHSLTFTLWKEYMLHDEVMSAVSLLENAPYRIRHTDETTTLLKKTKKCIAWIDDEELYDRHNAAVDHNDELLGREMVPLPGPLMGQAKMRMQWMTDRMPDKSKTLLDMACIDGEMSNRWGLEGYKVKGVDCCSHSIKIANEAAERHNTGATHVQCYFNEAPAKLNNEKFDYITCGDVYEHLKDPLNDLLIPARKLIKEDGKMLMVTPHGAWFRGQFSMQAHPWLWANEGLHWLAEKHRAHVIAPTVWTVVDHFRKAGWWVKSCTAVPQWWQDVPDQGNVCVEAYPNPPSDNSGKDIIFFVGEGWEDWTPHTVDLSGIGGSELAAINMSKQLVQLGNKVRVYSSCGTWGEGVYDGVEYYHTNKFHDLSCDVLITSRMAYPLSDEFKARAKLKALWVHDVVPKGLTAELAKNVDIVFALSNWHKDNILSSHPFLTANKVIVTQNGLDLSRFDVEVDRNPHKMIYSSSPDRALPVLLKVWPRIRKLVPDAELHIFYGFEYWQKAAANDSNQLTLINQIMQEMSNLSEHGVHYRGRVNQSVLASEFKSSGVWGFPTWFTETSCQLSGTLIFTNEGMKTIENVKVGDMVLTHKGRFRKVTELIKKEYSGTLYSFKRRKDFNPIVLTEEHPLLTATFHKRSDAKGNRVYSDKNLNIQWKTPEHINTNTNYLLSPKMPFGNLSEIKFSDYLDLPVDGYNKIGPKFNKRYDYKYIDNTIEITEEFMYMMGLFAAEGCASAKRGKQRPHYGQITFAMHLKEMDKAQRVIDFFGSGKIKQTSPNGITITLSHSVWAKFLATQIGTHVDKKIPSFVWDCSKEMQNAFISGMFGGDGCIKQTNDHNNAGKRYCMKNYTSISPSLAYGFCQLLANQGIYASVGYSKKREAYSIDWSADPKASQHRELDDFFATRVVKKQSDEYNGTVYNFEVEEDQSYVTDRTIVHNCISSMEAQMAGLPIITSAIAALNETVGERGTLLQGDWLSSDYQDRFVKEVAKAMLHTKEEQRSKLTAYACEHFNWKAVAQSWHTMFDASIGQSVATFELLPYQPIIDRE
jgi:glycosyltransferase involved in cell wall biosynthesis/intein/homing endonuclease/SAM-dependent methyltransferase